MNTPARPRRGRQPKEFGTPEVQLLPALLLALTLGLLAACAPASTPLPATPAAQVRDSGAPALPGWELVWSDEFDGPALNAGNWLAETGAGGWGNNELQFYTDRPQNLRLEHGMLVIEARQEDYRGSRYTSARIKTQYMQTFQYGRVEARIKLPTGKGIWPAFWMLGEDLPTAGWPRAGEIDIMENIGEPHTVYGTVHGPGYSGGGGVGARYTRTDADFAAEFHTFAVEWEPEEIRWLVDDIPFNRVRAEDTPGPWVFDHPFFILLNLAVGGNWPGNPDQTTHFPQQLLVDYVRVYRDPTLDLSQLQSAMLHASELELAFALVDGVWQATAFVTVVDKHDQPVEGAVVSAGWLGVVVSGATTEGVTNAEGVAGPFSARKTSAAKEVTFCIDDIYRAGATYDKSQNSATCAFQSP